MSESIELELASLSARFIFALNFVLFRDVWIYTVLGHACTHLHCVTERVKTA
jgi:hypothetical protein